MNNFNNNNYPYFQPIGQSNVIYVVNVADVMKAQTEAMIAAYNLGLQERPMVENRKASLSKNNQVIDMAYYTINNEKSFGIFTDKNLLDKKKTYCPNFEENIFHSKEKATEYLFNKMIQINDSYAEKFKSGLNLNFLHHLDLNK